MADSMMSVVRTAIGLQNHYNTANLPEGSLLEAKNVEINREGVISKSRGFQRYGNKLTALPTSIMEYNDRMVVLAGSQLVYDSDDAGTWTAWTGSFSAPDSSTKMRSIEVNGTMLLTTSNGVYRTDSLQSSPVRSGIPCGLMPELSLTGTGQGWFTTDKAVGYVVLWGRDDEQNNLHLGPPSFRETITNTTTTGLSYTSSGSGPYTVTVTHTAHGYSDNDYIVFSDASDSDADGTYQITKINDNSYSYSVTNDPGSGTVTVGKDFDILIKANIPEDIQAGDFYEIYRTEITQAATTDPGERYYKVFRGGITEGDVVIHEDRAWTWATGEATVTDTGHGWSTGDHIYIRNCGYLDEGIYEITKLDADSYKFTCDDPTVEYSGTLDAYKAYVYFTDIWDDSFLGTECYTNANQEGITQQNERPPYCRDLALWKGHTWYANTKKPEFILLQLLSVDELQNNDLLTVTCGSDTAQVVFGANESVTDGQCKLYTTGTDFENVRNTAKSLCRVLNQMPQNVWWYAHYVSTIDDPPGMIVIEARDLNTSSFSLTVNSGTPAGAWSPELPTSGTDVSSDPDAGPNRLYYSKYQMPEAVPDFNYEEIGGRANEIKRILPLRDSLIVLATEGVWRVSGEDEDSFVFKQLDPSVRIRAPAAAVVLNNSVYALCTQGIVRITESGTAIVSRDIEQQLKDIFDETDFATFTHAAGYESERQYILWTPLDTPRRAYVYNYLTRAWTTRPKDLTCSHVMQSDDVLYAGHRVDKYILRERKNWYAQSDYSDEDSEQTIDSVGTGTDDDGNAVTTIRITWDSLENNDAPVAGWQIYQSGVGYANVIVSEDLTGAGTTRQYELTLDREISYTASTCTVYYSVPSRVRWAPESCGNAAALKQFSHVQAYLEPWSTSFTLSPWRYKLGLSADIDTTETWARDFDVTTLSPGAVLRTMVPQNHQHCRSLNLIFEHNRCSELFEIVNVGYTARMLSDRTAVATP